jgi:mannitol-1-/sugar-/sorbitol-6-phosphatase
MAQNVSDRFPVLVTLNCRALLLDMDGVLIYSNPSIERTWAKWADRHGLDPEDVLAAAHGRPTIETVRLLTTQLDAAAETEWVERTEMDDPDGVVAIPGARELMAALPSDRFAVVTSATRRLAAARFAQVGLELPARLVTADDIARGKPDPAPYVAGAAGLGLRASDCVVVEDSPAGIASGLAAGATVIALATTYRGSELGRAHVVVEDLRALSVDGARAGWLAIHINR